MMYALAGPSGKIHSTTVGWSRRECEGNAFSYMSSSTRLGRDWAARFWKNWNGAQADLKRRGYKIIKIRMVKA